MNKLIIIALLIIILFFCCSPLFLGRSTSDIDIEQAYDLIASNTDNSDFFILDVRTPGEFEKGCIKNAININYFSKNFMNEVSKLDKSGTYLIYCKSGGRSAAAVTKMQKTGFKNVYNLSGGFDTWKNAGK